MVARAKRGPDGRFLKGGGGGPGRPCRETEQAYFNAFTSACSPEDLAAVVATMVGLAKAGDINAAKLVMQHALPVQTRMELRNWIPEEEKYRVAGSSPEEKSDEMLMRIVTKIKERRKYKAEQAKLYPT
jgi:hypothetical protein